MTKNFNHGFQEINKLLPKIKQHCDPNTSIIINLIEAYIFFSKITVGINPQASFNKILDIEKKLLNIIPEDHIFFEIVLYAKVFYYSTNQLTLEQAITCYEKLLVIMEKSQGKYSTNYYETLVNMITLCFQVMRSNVIYKHIDVFHEVALWVKVHTWDKNYFVQHMTMLT